jgi:hypothetical protein
MITDKEIETALAKEMEGRAYEHIRVSNMADTFFVANDFYTVKDGEVYMINDGILQRSGDNLLTLKSECRYVGKYNPAKVYKGKRGSMSQTEIKKRLKL